MSLPENRITRITTSTPRPLAEQIARAQADYDSTDALRLKAIAQKSARASSLERHQLATGERLLTLLRTEIANLNRPQSEILAETAQLRTEVARLNATIPQVRAEAEQAKTRATQARAELARLSDEITTVKAENEVLHTRPNSPEAHAIKQRRAADPAFAQLEAQTELRARRLLTSMGHNVDLD